MDWFEFYKMVFFFYYLKWFMDFIWIYLIFLEYYFFRGIIILCINKDKIRGKWNFVFWLFWDYMVNGCGVDILVIRLGRCFSFEGIGKILKCVKRVN